MSNLETVCREIVKTHSYMIVNDNWEVVPEEEGMLLDVQSANAILTVFDSLSKPENKTKLSSLTPEKAVSVCWKLIK